MIWHQHSFHALNLDQLYELIKLRVDVFVVEQTCPYPELDDKDRIPSTQHLFAYSEQGQMVAYARVLAPEVSYKEASIGRVIVAQSVRGQGVAHELMQRAIAIASEHWPQHDIKIGAQQHLQAFYRQQGFEACSAGYLEDGIPHIDMLLKRQAK
ncbi:GNAT family N-acetyltransferase [Shewanella waksmanii]|uniref:GNAT family N-acetyltransferase n=1 Tax=Shewanella waksmanii TaxID=213783 RepID=UPI003735CC01